MSKKAGERSSAAGLVPIPCASCGVEFQPYRSTQIHCSRRCRDNGSKATATRQAYRSRPEVRERIRGYRRLATANDADAVKRLNLKNSLRRYGISIETYEAKVAAQKGACILCGHIPPPGGIKAAARLHVDHDHETGVLRDLLCGRCNQGIGYFREDPGLLRKAADYIERHRS